MQVRVQLELQQASVQVRAQGRRLALAAVGMFSCCVGAVHKSYTFVSFLPALQLPLPTALQSASVPLLFPALLPDSCL